MDFNTDIFKFTNKLTDQSYCGLHYRHTYIHKYNYRPELLGTSLQTYLHLQTYLQTRVTVDVITNLLTFTNVLTDQSYCGLHYRHTYIHKYNYRPELLRTSLQTYLHLQTCLQTRVTGDFTDQSYWGLYYRHTFTNMFTGQSYCGLHYRHTYIHKHTYRQELLWTSLQTTHIHKHTYRPELLWTSLQTYLHLQTCLQTRVTVDFITDIFTFTNILTGKSYCGLHYRHTYIHKHVYRPELLWTSLQTYLHLQTYLQTRVTGDFITDILTFTNILTDKSYCGLH